MLKGPNEKDISKLHAEINQLVNQRFVLTTLVLTLFAASIVWMIPKDSPAAGTALSVFPFVASIILSSLIFGIYLWSHLLRHTLRIWTQYLLVTGNSDWEVDWANFRKESYSAYTKSSTIMFMLPNAIGILFPFLLAWIFSLKIESCGIAIISVLVGIASLTMMYLMGFQKFFDFEKQLGERWKKLRDAPADPPKS